ncbi:type II secretion system GspH family protein [Patescibacteria group bacterium]|nr:type II secretion system GspH family protein [Patescibacteria group bacterium]
MLHFNHKCNQKGFTIIELLVVLAIIAMLASAALAFYSQVRLKARDATREQNIKTIQTALNLYATNARTYPVSSAPGPCSPLPPANCSNISSCGEAITSSSGAGQTLVQDGSLPSIPTDPINQGNYKFYYSSNGLTYVLSYCLETDSIPQKSSGLNQATP